MVERGDLVAELLGHIEHQRHLVGAIAVVVDEDIAVEHARQRLHPQIAGLELVGVAFAAVFGGLDPGRAIDREVAHPGGGQAPFAAIDALGVLAAGHLEAIRRAGELHPLDRPAGDVLERDRAPAHQVGRSGQDLERGDPAVGHRAGKAGVLRPHRMLGPHVRRGRIGRLVAIGVGLDPGAGIIAEMAVDVDDPGGDELASAVDPGEAFGNGKVRAADRDHLAFAQQDGAVVDPRARAIEHRRADQRGGGARIGLVGRGVRVLVEAGGRVELGRGCRLRPARARARPQRQRNERRRGELAPFHRCDPCCSVVAQVRPGSAPSTFSPSPPP